MALAAFCLGSYEAFTEFALDAGADGADRFAYRVMLWIVLPAGIAAVACGALALGVLGPRPERGRPDGAATARSAAWWGLAVGSLVIGLAAAGAFFMFLDVSVTSGG
jgi:hypothetical protein